MTVIPPEYTQNIVLVQVWDFKVKKPEQPQSIRNLKLTKELTLEEARKLGWVGQNPTQPMKNVFFQHAACRFVHEQQIKVQFAGEKDVSTFKGPKKPLTDMFIMCVDSQANHSPSYRGDKDCLYAQAQQVSDSLCAVISTMLGARAYVEEQDLASYTFLNSDMNTLELNS